KHSFRSGGKPNFSRRAAPNLAHRIVHQLRQSLITSVALPTLSLNRQRQQEEQDENWSGRFLHSHYFLRGYFLSKKLARQFAVFACTAGLYINSARAGAARKSPGVMTRIAYWKKSSPSK